MEDTYFCMANLAEYLDMVVWNHSWNCSRPEIEVPWHLFHRSLEVHYKMMSGNQASGWMSLILPLCFLIPGGSRMQSSEWSLLWSENSAVHLIHQTPNVTRKPNGISCDDTWENSVINGIHPHQMGLIIVNLQCQCQSLEQNVYKHFA